MIENPTPPARYSPVARSLHWLTVALIILQFGIAWTMPDIKRGTLPLGLVGWHLTVGTAIFAVTLSRLAWRLIHVPPPPPRTIPTPLAVLSRATHWTMYALLLGLPVIGWINANARGWTVKLFGVVHLPRLVAIGTPWAMKAGDLHGNLALLLLATIALHIAGASYHALMLRDQTLARML